MIMSLISYINFIDDTGSFSYETFTVSYVMYVKYGTKIPVITLTVSVKSLRLHIEYNDNNINETFANNTKCD
jgi:hypothetical protein